MLESFMANTLIIANQSLRLDVRPKRALLVGDSVQLKVDAPELFHSRARDWKVSVAIDIKSGLRAVATLKPDVVLMDSSPAVPQTFRFARVASALGPRVPIALLTSVKDGHHVLRALMAGFRGYFLKPLLACSLIADLDRIADGGVVLCDQAQEALATCLRPMGLDGAMPLLSPREEEVLCCAVNRMSDKEIAEKLGIATGTVRSHISNVFGKLGVHRRREAPLAWLGME